MDIDALKDALCERYHIEREIARGGMAVVYLTHDREIDRDVALKVLLPELASSIQAERFLREIEIAAKLNHPNILSLHDRGEVDGLLYYTMPYVEGESLRERLDREKQLPIDEALRIAAEVADALHHAHGLGVVHRDIKPENILLKDDHALIADFGVARAVTEAGGEKLTQTGITVGTVSYMSPEQATGAKVDGRSDLYSLGCVLYEMIGGVPPFTGPSDQAILAKAAIEAPPALSTIRRATPPGVETLIRTSLAKNAVDRHDSAEHMRVTLSDPAILTEGADALGRQLAKPRWGRVAAAGVVVAAVAFGVWRLFSGGPVDPRAGVVAVLPFEVEGGLERPLDATSVANLLRSYFSYTERYRTVSGDLVDRAVVDLCPTPPIERSCGSQVATELGAQFHVTGTAAPVRGDSVQIVAYMTDEITARAIAPVSVRASLTDSYSALNRLFRELAVATASEGERVVAIAGNQTENPAALAAFLDGELYLAEFQQRAARRAYERAVGIDSNFALAWYRLSILYDWVNDVDRMFPAIEMAETHSERLSEHDRRFLFAFRPLIAGDVDQAEAVYLDLLEEDPNDVEALFQLGMMRWAYNWRRGRSAAEAVSPLQRLLELAPKHCLGAAYLMWGLTAAGDADGLADLEADTEESCPGWIDAHPIEAIRAYRVGDSAAYIAAMETIAVDPGGLQNVLLGTMNGAVPDLARFASIERMHATPEPDPQNLRGYYMDWMRGSTSVAGFELGRGRRAQAWLDLERLDSLPVTPAIAFLGSFATLLPGGVPPADAATIAARLEAWDPPTRAELDTMRYGPANIVNFTHGEWGPYERLYLLGLLKSQAGDFPTALLYADALEAMTPQQHFPSINTDLALGVRADVLFNEGRPAEALAALDSARWGINYNELWYAPMAGGHREAFLEAMVLQQLGRYQEALALYTYGIEHAIPGPQSSTLLAPSHLYRGEIYEDMGDIDQALWHYGAFTELWREADPEYQPMVEDVKGRIARLSEEQGAGG